MHYRVTLSTLLWALTLSFGIAAAQDAWGQQAVAAPYRLAADDVLSIQVINFPELSVPQAVVPPDGKISVPLLGAFPVAGLTTAEVAQALAAKWSEYVVAPSVSVSLSQKRKETVSIYGYVTHAQSVEYSPDLRLQAAIAQAGGAAPDGDLGRVVVTHVTGQAQTLDLSDPQAGGGKDHDLPLAPYDVIYVPERHVQISVLGEVTKPGSYDYTDQMTVLDALKEAGPINADTADLSGATLVHGGKESRLDLDSLLRQGEMSDNVRLSAGDRIFIPVLHNRTYVAGAVGKPGYYTFQPGDRVLDALNGSGGHTQDADLSKVNLIHVDKIKNVATVQTLDLNRFFQKGDLQSNAPLSPGDVLYVPVKGRSNRLSDVFSGLGALNIISSTVRLLVP